MHDQRNRDGLKPVTGELRVALGRSRRQRRAKAVRELHRGFFDVSLRLRVRVAGQCRRPADGVSSPRNRLLPVELFESHRRSCSAAR